MNDQSSRSYNLMTLRSSNASIIARNARLLWWGVALLGLTVLIGILASGLSADFASNPILLVVISGYGAVVLVYSRVRPDQRIADSLITVAQLFLVLLLGLLLSYAAAVVAMPYRDAQLLAIDQWLGFDRTAYVNHFTDKPWKVDVANAIYLCMLPQLAVVPAVLIFSGRIERLQRFVFAYGIALFATVVTFVFVPAVGAFVYFDLTPAQYAALPSDVYTPARTLDALRSGTMRMINLSNLEGLIAFPSFHTAAAIVYAWALWPVRPLRWLVAPLNLAIISTTPIGGAHYVIDVFAGLAVAFASIAVSGWFEPASDKVSIPAAALQS
jgi:hypothetical protein